MNNETPINDQVNEQSKCRMLSRYVRFSRYNNNDKSISLHLFNGKVFTFTNVDGKILLYKEFKILNDDIPLTENEILREGIVGEDRLIYYIAKYARTSNEIR